MPPVVYLHVGAPKTGTSFLQDILWENRAALARGGVTVPATRLRTFRATVDLRELPLQGRSPDVPGSWHRLVDEVLDATGTVVVSHELFSRATEEQAGRGMEALRSAEVHVVYTARDLGRQIPAEWQQQIQHRGNASMGEFVDDVVYRGPLAEWFWYVQDPAAVLRRWGRTLPPEHLHLITVPSQGTDPSLLWHRFATLIGFTPDLYETGMARSNTSLGAVEAELLRRVNLSLGDRLPLPGPHHRFVQEELAHGILARKDGKARFGLRPDRGPWLAEESQRLVEDIRTLGPDVAGDLDELLPSEPTPTRHPDDVEDAALLNAATDALAGVLDRLREQTDRAQAAENRLREGNTEVREMQATVNAARRDSSAVRRDSVQREHTAAALRAELEKRRSRPVKQAVIDLSRKHRSLMAARRRYWRLVNALRASRP